MDDQRDVIAFLADPASYGVSGLTVEKIETHISIIFLAGDHAYKLKRAVCFPYVDFSTITLRERFCRAELALNRRTAPRLYLEVRAITRSNGALSFDGKGIPVDWVVVMRRFSQSDLFDQLAERGKLSPRLMRDTADLIAAFHADAEPTTAYGGRTAIRDLIAANDTLLREASPMLDTPDIDRLRDASTSGLAAIGELLDSRRGRGRVRRCHGDLHLRNICLFEGRPTPFDCIEFNEALACIDVLYDLAFLVMDLLHRGMAELANLIFNRYLDRSPDVGGLPTIPSFVSLRAAIRAHVLATAERLTEAAGLRDEARSYLALATAALRPQSPKLIALGGPSGVGKSTVAQALGPGFRPVPGARVIRSDVIRKRLHGVAPETRLPPSAYGPAINERVYGELFAEAAATLAAGYTAILDATFLQPEERARTMGCAARAGATFVGIWLDAPADVLRTRIAARTGDASDADLAVLPRQLATNVGPIDWCRLDARGDVSAVVEDIRALAM
jgi:aminoglycoside phosphotransferase family enzyme